MSNASRCRATAAHYSKLAEAAANTQSKRAYRKLETLWLEMAPLAESFDRRSDESVKQRIYALMGTVEHLRQQRRGAREPSPRGRRWPPPGLAFGQPEDRLRGRMRG